MDFVKSLKFQGVILLCFLSISCVHYYEKMFFQNLSSTPNTIRDLSFFPVNGFRFRLSELENNKAVVIAIRNTNCPLSKKSGIVLTEIEKIYSKKGIKFIYVYVGKKIKEQDVKDDLVRFQLKGLATIDKDFTISDTLAAQTTGDVFVLIPGRRILFKGPVNNFYHLSSKTTKPKLHYVQDMLDDVISEKSLFVQQKNLSSSECVIPRPIIKKRVFYEDIMPIIKTKCAVCHNPVGSAPMNLLNYSDLAGRKTMLRYVLNNNLMPPWHNIDKTLGPWENDLSLTAKEKALLLRWLSSGLPYRNASNRKKYLTKTSNFIKNPDYIIKLPHSVTIPPTGLIPYKEFIIDPGFKEDKWIRKYEFVLKPKIVHHSVIRIVDKCFLKKRKTKFQICSKPINKGFSIWIGSRFAIQGFPKFKDLGEDLGIKVPKGSVFLFQIHYGSIGKKIIDNESEVRIQFLSTKPKYKRVSLTLLDTKLNIPSHQKNYLSEMKYRIKQSAQLVSATSHMHLRGKATSISVINPKGTEKKILRLDPFNYNLQRIYYFKNPKEIAKDSTLVCRNWFDNSSENPVNPNFKQSVTWGEMVNQEMSLCAFHLVVPTSANLRDIFPF